VAETVRGHELLKTPGIVRYVSVIIINTDHKHLARAAFSLMDMDIRIKFSISFDQNDVLQENLSGGKFRDLFYSKDYTWVISKVLHTALARPIG
jgi:hypothetical protein